MRSSVSDSKLLQSSHHSFSHLVKLRPVGRLNVMLPLVPGTEQFNFTDGRRAAVVASTTRIVPNFSTTI